MGRWWFTCWLDQTELQCLSNAVKEQEIKMKDQINSRGKSSGRMYVRTRHSFASRTRCNKNCSEEYCLVFLGMSGSAFVSSYSCKTDPSFWTSHQLSFYMN